MVDLIREINLDFWETVILFSMSLFLGLAALTIFYYIYTNPRD